MHINLKQEQNYASVKNGLKQCSFLNNNIWNEEDPVFALHVNVTNQWSKSIPEKNIEYSLIVCTSFENYM